MGTLGWTEEQTLQTTIPSINLAYEGYWETHGGGTTATPVVSSRPLTPALFDAVFPGER